MDVALVAVGTALCNDDWYISFIHNYKLGISTYEQFVLMFKIPDNV